MKVEFEKPYDEDDDDFDFEEFADTLREVLLSAAEESLKERGDKKYITFPDVEKMRDYNAAYELLLNAVGDDAKVVRSSSGRSMTLSIKSVGRDIPIKNPKYFYLAMKAASSVDISPYTSGILGISLTFNDVYKKELVE